MNYSFVKPDEKTILKKVTRIWWIYIILTLILLVGFFFFLKAQGEMMQTNADAARAQQLQLAEEIKRINDRLASREEQVAFGKKPFTQNALLEETINNLFAIIPEQITLKKVEMLEDKLTLYGTTPSKEIYQYLLEVPLRSVFSESHVQFYPLANGWLNFVSVSTVDGGR